MNRHRAASVQQSTAAILVVVGVFFALSTAPAETIQGPIPQEAAAPGRVAPIDTTEFSAGSAATETILATVPLGGVGGSAAALLLSGQSDGEIEGAVFWTASGDTLDGDRTSIQVLVEIDGLELLASTDSPTVPIDVYGYLVDSTGAIVAHLAEGVVLDSAPLTRAVEEQGLKFVGNLSVLSGVYSFRILVRNRETQRYFLGRREIEVRTPTRTDPLLLPPLIAEPDHRWVISAGRGLDLQKFRDLIPGTSALPSAMPTWRTDRPLEAVIPCSQLEEQQRLSSHIIDNLGETVLEPAIQMSSPFASQQNLFFYRVSVPAPNLPPGRYRLVLSMIDSETEGTTSQSIPVLIHDQKNELVWTDPDAPRRQIPAPLPSPTEPPTSDPAVEVVQSEPMVISIESLPIGEAIASLPLRGVGARAAALLLAGQSGGEIEGAVLWTSTGAELDGSRMNIQFYVEIEGRGLLAPADNSTVPIEIYGYLIDTTGTVIAHLAEGILLDGGPLTRAVEYSGLKFVGSLSAPPGLYSFRILARNRETQRFFLARRDFDVRAATQTDSLLLPPLIAEPEDRWVIAGRGGRDLQEFEERIPGMSAWPAAMPTWRTDRALEAVIACSQLGENQRLSTQLIDRLGHRVLDPAVQVSPPIASQQHLYFYRATVAAPDVPAGPYRFVLSLTNSDTGETISQSLPMLIHDSENEFVWTDPEAPRAAAPRPLPRQAEHPTPGDLEVEIMRSSYLEVLRLWSEGETLAARRALAALEHPLESSTSPRNWRQLITVERLTAMTLAKNNPDSLMAIAMLHRDMYGWYLARTETDLARHSWQMAAMLARLAPRLGKGKLLSEFGESLLIDLAGRLVQSGQPKAARDLLTDAIDVDPHSAPGLLGLGALFERTGFPDEAEDEFRRLYDAHPDRLEGQLRLAVNWARIGSKKSAEELFRGLQSSSSPLWIRTLAYQEMARLLVARERFQEAEVLLRQGIAAIPENQRLQIQLAHVLDLDGRPAEATVIVERLQTPELAAGHLSTVPVLRLAGSGR